MLYQTTSGNFPSFFFGHNETNETDETNELNELKAPTKPYIEAKCCLKRKRSSITLQTPEKCNEQWAICKADGP